MEVGRGKGASDVIRRTALFMPTPVSAVVLVHRITGGQCHDRSKRG